MKICIYNLTTGLIFGGIEVFTINLAETLARRGEEVYLFTGRGHIFFPEASFKIKRYLYLPHRYIPDLGTRFRKFVSRLTFALFSFRDLCRERFDIIHIQKPYDLPAVILIKFITGARIILGSHGTDFYFGDRLLAKMVDGVFSCSAFNAGEIKARYGVKARVIYNGCDIDLFKPKEADKVLKEKFALGDTLVIITTGRLVNWKRMDILIEALPLLKTTSFKVIICGTGEDKKRLIDLSRALGVDDKIIWAGKVEHKELPRYLSLATIYVQPSVSESFGMSICEAMAMEIPIVATASGGVREVVTDNVCGRLCKPMDVKKVAKNIDVLLADREMRLRMGRKGRQKIEAMFTWEKVADRVMEGYRCAFSS
jgi:glycosyltransferase involved in cell wall biosynthesis